MSLQTALVPAEPSERPACDERAHRDPRGARDLDLELDALALGRRSGIDGMIDEDRAPHQPGPDARDERREHQTDPRDAERT